MSTRRSHPWRYWTDAERRTLTTMHLAGTSDAEIGAAVGHTSGAVAVQRQNMGLGQKHKRWTENDFIQLARLLEEHTSWNEIAHIMDRNGEYIRRMAYTRGMTFRDQSGHYSMSAVSLMLCVNEKAIRKWVVSGRLKAVRVPCRSRNTRVFVDHENLVEFLENEDNWHLYKPERITDLALREWTTEIRGNVRFLTCREAAKILHMTPLGVQTAIRQGRLWGVQLSNRNSIWLLRSDRLQLVERPHGTGPRFSPQELATIRHYWGRQPATWIAVRLGRRSSSGVLMAARRMGLPPVGRGHWKRVKVR